MERTNQVLMLVGRRKSGKTYLGRKIIDSTKFSKVLVIDTFEHPDYSDFQTIQPEMLSRWKKGKKRILCYDQNDDAFKAINDNVRNTLIVMEDCTKYITGDLSRSIRGIIFDSKQKNNDVLLMYHGFAFAPPKLLSNVNYITLFKIGENIENAKSKIPNYDTILKGHRIIQSDPNPYINKTFLVN